MILFRIFFNLMGLALRLFWLPLLIIKRNLFIVILLLIVLFVYSRFQDAKTPAQVTPAAATVAVQPRADTQAASSGQVLVEAVRRRENGDSAFSTDLYAIMDAPQRAYYSQLFFWAMSNLPTGQSHAWAQGNINGRFTPTDDFRNKSGVRCRHFSEMLKVRSIEQTLTGTACEKPNGAWCKLKPNATPACGLSGEKGFWDSIKDIF